MFFISSIIIILVLGILLYVCYSSKSNDSEYYYHGFKEDHTDPVNPEILSNSIMKYHENKENENYNFINDMNYKQILNSINYRFENFFD